MYPKTLITALVLAPSAMGMALPSWFGTAAPAAGLDARDAAFRAEAARLAHREPVAAPAPVVVEIPHTHVEARAEIAPRNSTLFGRDLEARNSTLFSRGLFNTTAVEGTTLSKRANLTLEHPVMTRDTHFKRANLTSA